MQTPLARFAARPTGALTVRTDMVEKFEEMVYKGTIGTTLNVAIHDVVHDFVGMAFKPMGIACPRSKKWTS